MFWFNLNTCTLSSLYFQFAKSKLRVSNPISKYVKLPPLTIKYCRIASRPPMLNLSAALRVHVCCCLWVSIGVAERSPGSVAEFKFGCLTVVVARLGMWFSASPCQDECGVWSVKLFNALRQPCRPGICISHLGNILL